MKAWHELMDSEARLPAVIVGKGPSLDRWLAAGCPRPEGAVVIGINNVAAVLQEHGVEVPYSVSGDVAANDWVHLPTQWVRGVPYRTGGGVARSRLQFELPSAVPFWFVADDGAGAGLLGQTRLQIADRRQLFTAMVSTTPAVHFAWYLGCGSVMLVGIDGGGGGRAEAVASLPDRIPPPDPIYQAGRACVLQACRKLFGEGCWGDWNTEIESQAKRS